ncbi:hypothetical protein [Pontibacter pudoricolor]|uniref:hypothetical protein n=1 Tax=Pontibacter pudoricolor TaxID=2694930 RepID=UPI001390DF85|nr:hypothetical protein [Pontibacter pudoricolor]
MEKSTLKEDLLLATIGVILLAMCLWDGIGITFDSHLYLLGSSYLSEHGFSGIFTVPAFKAKPPLLSMLYALLQNNLSLIKLANLFFLAGTLLINFRLVNRLVTDTFFRRFTKALLSIATPFMLVHSFLWSEPFFIFILSLYYLFSYKSLVGPKKTWALYLLPLLGVMLIGLRHIGIVFTLVMSLYLLLHYRKFSKYQLIPVLLNMLLPVFALLAWHRGVLMHGGNAEGYNLTGGLDLFRNFVVYADVLRVWLLPPGLPLPEVLSVLAFIVYGIVAGLAIKQSYSSGKQHLVLLFVTSAASYAGFMLLKGDLLIDDNERYLAVIYAPLTLLLFYVISNRSLNATIDQKLIWVICVLWFCYPLARTAYNVNRWSQNGINTYKPETAPERILKEYQNPRQSQNL